MNGKCLFRKEEDMEEYASFMHKVLYDYCAANPGWIYDLERGREGKMFSLEATIYKY